MKVLLVEDDIVVGESMKICLEDDKFIVDWIQDGLSAERAALDFEYDVIIMDINLPKKNGLNVIKSLRLKDCLTPTLVLTANDSTEDCINGLANGADDYIVKPFQYEEIRERLNALVRRDRRAFRTIREYKELTLDTRKREVKFKGSILEISAHEYIILEILMSEPNRTFTRSRLMDSMYGWDDSVTSNTLEVFIFNLRKKLEKSYIKTVRGVGYSMG